jgi:5-hydroxyisourate hydrolase-like protein (transthyretin family)
MTDEPKGQPNDRETVRQNRLREALRENLKRRKSQARGRIGQAAVSEQGAPEPDEAE